MQKLVVTTAVVALCAVGAVAAQDNARWQIVARNPKGDAAYAVDFASIKSQGRQRLARTMGVWAEQQYGPKGITYDYQVIDREYDCAGGRQSHDIQTHYFDIEGRFRFSLNTGSRKNFTKDSLEGAMLKAACSERAPEGPAGTDAAFAAALRRALKDLNP